LKLPAFSEHDFSNLRCFISAAAAMPPEYLNKLDALPGCKGKFVEVMGMTETSPVLLGSPLYGKKKVGSVGLPWPDVEIKLVDPETKELVPLGEAGELVAKGPQVFKGYFNMPQETANTLRDGWIYTGDILRMDEEGYFFVMDRSKDMINVSGFKVFTRELDDLLVEHPDVAMAATIGLTNPDRPGTEIVTSAVVLKPGVEKSEAAMNSILEYVKKNASPYKVPKKIVFLDELPINSVGKILKRELRDMLK